MHERNVDYICLFLFETGIGKRSFLSSITKSSEINVNNNCCKTSPNTKACTKIFQLSRTNYGFALYLFYFFIFIYIFFFIFFYELFSFLLSVVYLFYFLNELILP